MTRIAHNPRCAIFRDPPGLREDNDCNCGAIPPLSVREAAQRVVANTPRNTPQPVGVDELREALAESDQQALELLECLKVDFEREAQERYHRGEDGSDWQEAHRRVEALMRDALSRTSPVAVAEDPVREAADNVLIHLSVGGHVSAGSPAINRLREALGQPAPPSLTDDERKALLKGRAALAPSEYPIWRSARAKLS